MKRSEGKARCAGGCWTWGLTPKTKVTVRKVAPMGDPIELYLRGYVLTLRAEDAAKITIREEAEA